MPKNALIKFSSFCVCSMFNETDLIGTIWTSHLSTAADRYVSFRRNSKSSKDVSELFLLYFRIQEYILSTQIHPNTNSIENYPLTVTPFFAPTTQLYLRTTNCKLIKTVGVLELHRIACGNDTESRNGEKWNSFRHFSFGATKKTREKLLLKRVQVESIWCPTNRI